MSKKLSKLDRELKKILEKSGVSKQPNFDILQGLGQLQALVESYQNGESDPVLQQQLKQLQSQLGFSDLDEESVSQILKSLSELNTHLESLIPTLVKSTGMDERSIFNHLRRLSENNGHLNTKDLSKTVTKLLKKRA